MSSNVCVTKNVKLVFETTEYNDKVENAATLMSIRFQVPTSDALIAVEKAVEACRALFGGLKFKCKSVEVGGYGD
jgi:hypothetical protein